MKDIFPFEEDDLEVSGEIDFICSREVEVDEMELLFVDFNENDDMDSEGGVISPDVFTKRLSMDNDYYDDNQIKNEFIEKCIELSEKNFTDNEELYNKFNFNPSEYTGNLGRKLMNKILNGSNLIAAGGRIGPSQYMIISEDNYIKYNLSMLYDGIKTIFHDIDDIILFRKNGIDQPGLIYVKNILTNKYVILAIGFHPGKQFLKIKLTD